MWLTSFKSLPESESETERSRPKTRGPKEHWLHPRTSNVVESPFASIRLRTDAAKRYTKVTNATAAIWKLLMVAEKGFRRLQGYEPVAKVADGVEFKDWIEVVKVSSSYTA